MPYDNITSTDNSYSACPYCTPDTGGNHEPHCPLHPDHHMTRLDRAYGWVCPKCGSVYGPSVSECWRCNPPTPIITWEHAMNAASHLYETWAKYGPKDGATETAMIAFCKAWDRMLE